MKRSWMIVMVSVSLALGRLAAADGTPAAPEKKPAVPAPDGKAAAAGQRATLTLHPSGSGVHVLRFGDGVKIGSDGKVLEAETIIIGDPSKKLPAEVQKLVTELSQSGGKVIISTSRQGGAAAAASATTSESPGKTVTITKGEMKVIVIGPDGKKTETVIDLGNVNPLSSGAGIHLKPLLDASGVKLPEEVRKALEAVEQARKKAAEARIQLEAKQSELQRAAEQLRASGAQAHKIELMPAKPMAEVNAKLDKILERLDRLEKEVQSLKPAHK